MQKSVLFLSALTLFIPVSAQARPYHLTKVAWIVATRNKITYDDRYVTIMGHVTRRMGDEEYWFTDGSGSIRLDSENFDLPIGPRLIIGGRIDQAYLGFGHIEVDVRRWRYAPLRRGPMAPAAPSRAAMTTPSPAARASTPENTPSTQATAPSATHVSTAPPTAPSPSSPAPALAPPPESGSAPANSAPANAPTNTPVSTAPTGTNTTP